MSSDSNRHTAALASITATYTDSEEDPDSDVEINKQLDNTIVSRESTPSSLDDRYMYREKTQVSTLVSYTEEAYEDDMEHSEESQSPDYYLQDDSIDSRKSNSDAPPLSPVSFHRSLISLKVGEIQLPADPPGRCSKSLQEKISELYVKKLEGKDMNASMQLRKSFRNPSIYEKLIAYCNIDERGTNYPPEIYDPHCWGPESFYEELAKRQKEEMDRREREKKERTKVEFMSGTAKKPATDTTATEVSNKRKSKWDVGITQATTALKPATLVTPSVLPVATGTKPTVISAFGTITKKSKQ